MPRIPKLRRTYSPNQVVALNVARARAMRGWTQEEAAAALSPHLGLHWSTASFSAVERSIRGTRVKQFSADELVALSRGFGLPIGWFFLPPPPDQDAGLHVPDGKLRGVEFEVLLDTILGTPDSLPFWRQALLDYASELAAVRAGTGGEGQTDEFASDLARRVDAMGELRAAALLRESFGDVTEARDVLIRLANVLTRLEEAERGDTSRDEAALAGTETEAPAQGRRRRQKANIDPANR
jgi:transcriptional regulator with XRE-family HTH domain